MKKGGIVVAGVAIIAIVLVAFYFVVPSQNNVLGFGGGAHAEAGSGDEYIKIDVTVSRWQPPFSAGSIQGTIRILATNSFWTVDGEKKTTASGTISITITYSNIKANSLNVTIAKLWMEYSTATSYIVDDAESSVNGANEAGTVTKEYSGSKSVDSIADELNLPTDGTTSTVYNKFRVQVTGIGTKSGQPITADTGTEDCTPASNSWKYETEEVTDSSSSGSVSFSSWVAIAPLAGVLVGFGLAVVVSRRARK